MQHSLGCVTHRLTPVLPRFDVSFPRAKAKINVPSFFKSNIFLALDIVFIQGKISRLDMDEKKEIIVLNGKNHKGLVKLRFVVNDLVKGRCNLDFRPSEARLYLIGDDVAEIILKDTATDFEVPFRAGDSYGCLVRSSSTTLFGGTLPKNKILSRVDDFLKSKNTRIFSANNQNNNHSHNQYPYNAILSNQRQNDIANGKSNGNDAANNASNRDTTNNAKSDDTANDINNSAVNNARNGNAKNNAGNNDAANNKNIDSTANSTKIDTAQADARGFHSSTTPKSIEELDEWIKYDGNNFYYAIKPQLDEMFVRYPEEKRLNEAVANSKWIRVDTDKDYYVVGLLFNEDEPSFICYGVPSSCKTQPPEELSTACVWLPVGDGESGYWAIYQSARNGEIVK